MSSSIDIRGLTAEERLALLGELWDSLAPEDIPLNEAQRTELDRRLDDFEADRDPGIPWEEVLRRILGRSRRMAAATDTTEHQEEPEYYFHFSATLRIFGDIGDLNAITAALGVAPTHTHRRGERRRSTSPDSYEHDMWSYLAPVPEERPLQVHLEALWRMVRPRVAYLKELKQRLTVDVFCGYRSDCRSAGFEVDHRALVIFTELEVPFGVSVVI